MNCNCNKDCKEENKELIFSDEAKRRLIEYIAIDKWSIGDRKNDEPSDYDKFVMQHDADIKGAINYIEDLEKRWLEEVKVNCKTKSEINDLTAKLQELEYNNKLLVERNDNLAEENFNLKEYIYYEIHKSKLAHTKGNVENDINKTNINLISVDPKDNAKEFKTEVYDTLFKNTCTTSITFNNQCNVKITDAQDRFNEEIINVIEMIAESVDDLYIPSTLAKLREIYNQIIEGKNYRSK